MSRIKNRLKEGGLTVSMPVRQKDRLKDKCFRGRECHKAGNFFTYGSFEDVMSDAVVRNVLLKHLKQAFSDKAIGTQSFTVEAERMVGWSSTAERKYYVQEDLEPFKPNQWSNALRVKLEATDRIKAPKTSTLVFVCELKYSGRNEVVLVHSLYPGADIGDLCDDITEREGIVFFTWEHPGEE